ncbi:hypothetical protein J7L67_09090, partial [bacterium]|nr:hypothetical protein [bacterium]
MNVTAEIKQSKNIFRLPLFPFCAISFVIGLLCGEFFSAVDQSFVIIFILFLSISSIFIKKYKMIIFIIIFFLFGLFRIVNYNENFLAGQNFLSSYVNKNKELFFSGKIVSFPSVKNFGSKDINQKIIKFYCNTNEIEKIRLKAKILVYA